MKNTKNIMFGTVLGLFFTFGILGTSCSKWTQPEAEDYYTPPTQAYTDNMKDYFGSPHKEMFGWFGNWTGEGGSMGGSLMGLPDSVDFVSLWLCYGNLNQAQQNDLKAFQERGGRAYLCWTARNIGEGLTTDVMKLEDGTILKYEDFTGTDEYLREHEWRAKFWGFEDGTRESKLAATVKFAKALADTCRKYNIDGYDYDMEALGDLCTHEDTSLINTFFRTLIQEFAKDGRNLNIDIPGGTGWLSYYDMVADDVLRDVRYMIWQTYELGHSGLENFFNSEYGVRGHKPHMFETVFEKSIVTATFERAVDKHYFLEQASWVPSFGLDFKGLGAYHIEYDYPDAPDSDVKSYGVRPGVEYPHVRKAITMMNPQILK